MEQICKTVCPNCEVNLEYPAELGGSTTACPKCAAEVLLPVVECYATDAEVAFPEGADAALATEPEGLSVAKILAGFRGELKGHRTSMLYQVGLLLVALMSVTLPLIYVALVAGAAYAVYWWSRAGLWMFSGGIHGGAYALMAKGTVYAAPLFAGVVMVFFMLKPLLAREAKGAQPLALNPASEPLIFLLVTRISQVLGAPMPTRIDVNGELNASAGFRRGFRSFFGRDLVLTLGLPLVASMTVTQLAGVIGHELGHFTQGFAMRLSYVIRRVNEWFARVAFQRDQWDLALLEWADDAEHLSAVVVLTCARFAVWTSRLVLRCLMLVGVGASSFVSRQMEYDADLYEMKLVGSGCFEEVLLQLGTLGAALYNAYIHMRTAWNTNNVLPDNFPAFVLQHAARIPAETREAIVDRVGLQRGTIFSTHPATGNRIGRARRASEPGVFALDVSAKELFSDFDVIARQVSLLHYTDDLSIPRPMVRLRPAETFFTAAPAPPPVEEVDAQRAGLIDMFGPAKLKLKTKTE